LTADEVALLYSTGSLTGINEILAGELASVVQSFYPNPVTNELIIEHSFNNTQPLLLKVYDVQGRQVDAIQFSKDELPADQFSINVEQYASGTYFLNFVLGGKNLGSLKFIK